MSGSPNGEERGDKNSKMSEEGLKKRARVPNTFELVHLIHDFDALFLSSYLNAAFTHVATDAIFVGLATIATDYVHHVKSKEWKYNDHEPMSDVERSKMEQDIGELTMRLQRWVTVEKP